MPYVKLKGLHRVNKQLASGEIKRFTYVRGTRDALPGVEGSPEFMAAYYAAIAKRTQSAMEKGTFADLIGYYKSTADYTELKPSTKKDYNRYLKLIEAEFGDMPRDYINDSPEEVRGDFLDWRDSLSGKKRTADMAWSVLAKICAVAHHRGKIKINPCLKGGRLYESDRTEKIWRVEHFTRLFAKCSKQVSDVVILGLFTGLREGKCISLSKTAYRDGYLHVPRFKRSKNHTPIRIAVKQGTALFDMLGGIDWAAPATMILTNTRGAPWTEDGFRTSFGKACKAAGIGAEFGEENDLHFHDLRGTAVTLLALAGCKAPEIASVTGHSLKTVDAILEKHYLGDRAALADRAIEKLFASESPVIFMNRTKT